MSSYKLITVGEFTEQLSGYAPETEVTFGSSTYSHCPLIFERFKRYGEDVLLIELSEIDESHGLTPEHLHRITVGYILEQLSVWRSSDKIDFGCTIDGIALELKSVTNAVSLNFQQSEPPEGRYVWTKSA